MKKVRAFRVKMENLPKLLAYCRDNGIDIRVVAENVTVHLGPEYEDWTCIAYGGMAIVECAMGGNEFHRTLIKAGCDVSEAKKGCGLEVKYYD